MTSLDEEIKKTIKSLSDLFVKPKLTEKLLTRPPFRFLHDIVNAVLKATGFPDTLYNDYDLDSKNVKDKSSKMKFLQTLIDCVQASSALKFEVNAAKIVAGVDAVDTNHLLQAFGALATQVKSGEKKNDEIIARYRGVELNENTLIPSESLPTRNESSPKPNIEAKIEEEISATPLEVVEAPTIEPLPSATLIEPGPSDALKHVSKPSLGVDNEAPEYIQATQRAMNSLIKKPKMLTNLLKRPPFRFLHDIVKELNRSTDNSFAFAFSNEEMTEKIKDAKAKVNFLDKLITFVSNACGRDLAASSKKIVAGLEAENTNELLRELADAVSNGSIVALKASVNTLVAQDSNSATANELEPTTDKEPTPTPEHVIKETPAPIEEAKVTHSKKQEVDDSDETSGARQILEDTVQNKNSESLTTPLKTETPVVINNLKPSRPATARKAPPKVRSNVVVKQNNSIEHHRSRDSSSRTTVQGVIMEGEDVNDDDEDEPFNPNDVIDDDPQREEETTDVAKQGKLVRDILQEQERSKEMSTPKQTKSHKQRQTQGIAMSRIGHVDRNKEGKGFFSQQQIEDVRQSIQRICQSVNPLGKCVDFVFDDIVFMNQEVEKWRKEHKRQKQRLHNAERETEEHLQEMRGKLTTIEGDLKERHRQVQDARANILRNQTRLTQMLQKHANR